MEGIAGKAAKFDGTSGYAKIGQTSGPHINTERSFTVSAWAKLDKKPSGAAVITAQGRPSGSRLRAVLLGRLRPVGVQPVLQRQRGPPPRGTGDAPDGTTARASAHLVGVHDTTANTLTLYVNGAKAGTTTLVDAFYADQSMYIGASHYGGAMGAYFPGTIDDVRVMDRPASAEEVAQMFRQRPLVKARWNFETVTDASPATSPDASDNANTMTLGGQAKQATGWSTSTGCSWTAWTTTPPQPASRWTPPPASPSPPGPRRPALPTQNASVVSRRRHPHQRLRPALHLGLHQRRRMGSYSATSAPATTQAPAPTAWRTPSSTDAREWNHLALVYDGFAREARLYVNGVLQETACTDADGNGDADDTTCQT
ncbi:LamG-like jellyroll fold domain-containing protein [Streptomyces sp. KL116D]|uniref:LamG domain-containing protein n=1 Tax=Streptomyces sp. KL116D TaxID=3045152 RepID=UPI00355667B6